MKRRFYKYTFKVPCAFCGKILKKVYFRAHIPLIQSVVCNECRKKNRGYTKEERYQWYVKELNKRREKYLISKKFVGFKEIEEDQDPEKKRKRKGENPNFYFKKGKSEVKVGDKIFKKLDEREILVGRVIAVEKDGEKEMVGIQKWAWEAPFYVPKDKIMKKVR